MRFQRGVTLIELLVALLIMSTVVVGTSRLVDQYLNDTTSAVTAQHMATVGQAAQSYIQDNYAAVSAVATAATPALIKVSTLTGAGYLTNGFSATNSHNQTVCVLVLEPTPGQLNALVVSEGGTAIDDLTLGGIASVIGAAGGGVYASDATNLRGAMGGWITPIGSFANANASGQRCDGSAGNVAITAGHPIMALWFNGGDVTAGFLYRDPVPGHPELNQMNTALDMNNNAINNAATIALNTIVVNGAVCTTNGVVARDANGAVMSCQGGTWKSQGSAYWQDPVPNVGILPACNAAVAWQTRIVQVPTIGTGPRGYTCNGASWQALAVDDSGNLMIPGGLTVNGNTTLGDAVTDTVSIPGTATINKLAGNLEVTVTVTEGAACSPNGRIARDGNGLLLSCQSGVWKRDSKSLGNYIALSTISGAVQLAATDGIVLATQSWTGAGRLSQCQVLQGGVWVTVLTGSLSNSGIWGPLTCPFSQGTTFRLVDGLGSPFQSVYWMPLN